MISNTDKRLSELGVAESSKEIDVLREENNKLREELENRNKEIELLKKTFEEAVSNIIAQNRAIQPFQLRPYVDPNISVTPWINPNTWTGDHIRLVGTSIGTSSGQPTISSSGIQTSSSLVINSLDHSHGSTSFTSSSQPNGISNCFNHNVFRMNTPAPQAPDAEDLGLVANS